MAEHQLRDENGQWVSIGTLFERERLEHGQDHERERQVALETARRMERMVEEASIRIEKGVATALNAVAATAAVHAEAHTKEHMAHERIHIVEEENRTRAAASVDKRLDGMNEFRGALQDQSNRAVTRDYYDVRHEELREKVTAMEKRMAYYAGGAAVAGAVGALLLRLIGE